jgi:hypothetical protein
MHEPMYSLKNLSPLLGLILNPTSQALYFRFPPKHSPADSSKDLTSNVGFILRKWNTNSKELREKIESEKTASTSGVPNQQKQLHNGRTVCRKTLCRKTFCRKTFFRTDILPTDGRVAERTFYRTESLPNGQFSENRDIF